MRTTKLTASIGKLEVDWDVWEDHDEDVHGEMDPEELRREFPVNYTYSCCDEDGTAGGCQTTRHKQKEQVSKRARNSPNLVVKI